MPIISALQSLANFTAYWQALTEWAWPSVGTSIFFNENAPSTILNQLLDCAYTVIDLDAGINL
jgi:hypothetical protein